jgi:thiamine-monophosphate kinase
VTVAEVGERALIERIRARLPPPPPWVLVGPGDDGAVLALERGTVEVVTTDVLVEGVHFERAWSTPADLGYKALAVNLSDLAAMGADPRAALLSLVLPPALPASFVDALIGGVLAAASEHRVVVAGGNIARSPGPLMVDVAALGSVRRRKILTRGGARPGDLLLVSGSLGAARAGLEWLRATGGRTEGADADEMAACATRWRRPVPRVRLGRLLGRTRAATACVDLSDGLADALRQLVEASGVGAVVEAAAVPVDPAARRWFERQGVDPVVSGLTGGEDYELLFTVSPRHRGRLRHVASHVGGVPLTRIGEIVEGRGIVLRRDHREDPWPEGFAHF